MDLGDGLDVGVKDEGGVNNCYQVFGLSNEVNFGVICRGKEDGEGSKYWVDDQEISFRQWMPV